MQEGFSPNAAQLVVIVPVLHNSEARRRERLDRQRQLNACLSSLVNSRLVNKLTGPERWSGIELLIVDDRSKQPVETILSQPVLDNVYVLRNTGTDGQAGALNAAMAQVSADVFAFTDSDCIVAPDWLTRIGAHYRAHPEHLGVSGPNWLFQDARSAWPRIVTRQESRLMQYIFETYIDRQHSVSRRIDCRNFSVRASYLDAHYPGRRFFTEGRGPSVSGQTTHDIQSSLIDNSLEIGFAGDMHVFHYPVESMWAQVVAYFQRGYQGNFHKIYRKGYRTLGQAFRQRYVQRHFVAPIVHNRAGWPYVGLVHGAYWAGIVGRAWQGDP